MALDLNDKTSNANNLTNSGVTENTTTTPFATSTSTGSFVRASSQYAYITDAAQNGALDITGDFTFEAWVYLTSMPSGDWTAGRYIAGKFAMTQPCFQFVIDGNRDPYVNFGTQGGNMSRFDAPALNATDDLNKWIHLAVTVDISVPSAQFYRDGSTVTTTTIQSAATSLSDGTGDFFVGARYVDPSVQMAFDGYIDELRLWSGQRSGTEISNNYQSELSGSESGLVFYLPFEELGGGGGTITPLYLRSLKP